MNRSARDTLVELIEIDGRTLLRYKPFPLHVAVLRGSCADPDGNISQEEEPANLEAFAMALAAHNSGGVVIVQVRNLVEYGQLPARAVRIPGALVDAVVVAPRQPQCHAFFYDPSISGQRRAFAAQDGAPQSAPPDDDASDPRSLIANRAAQELFENAVINFGFGIPDAWPSWWPHAAKRTVTIRRLSTAHTAARSSTACCSVLPATPAV